MTKLTKILIVDDNPEMVEFISMELELEGYQVSVAKDGMNGLIMFRQLKPDLIILDWEMPNLKGIEVCHQIRRSSETPILMLTAKKELEDKIKGLDAGANDYLVKPFALSELLARIRAIVNRLITPPPLSLLYFDDLTLDLHNKTLKRNEQLIALTPNELKLLTLFMQKPQKVLSKLDIIHTIWGDESEITENNLEVSIHNLRSKIEKNSQSRLIHTKSKFGYIFQK